MIRAPETASPRQLPWPEYHRGRRRCGEKWVRDMSFWKLLLGGKSSGGDAAGKASPPEDYNGFTIRAAPFKTGSQFQAAGYIAREIGGERKEHHFIRADFFSAEEEAVRFSLTKARQIVDLEGDRVFD
jgi:hypothetical protein